MSMGFIKNVIIWFLNEWSEFKPTQVFGNIYLTNKLKDLKAKWTNMTLVFH